VFAAAALGAVLVLAPPAGARASDAIETAGDVLQVVLPATAYVTTAVHKDGEGALAYTKAAALTLGVTYTLKYTVDEERPNGGAHSFPSGHTSISFSAAEFLRKRYGWEYGLPAYAAAAFVGYSRVEADEHWWWDVVAGAAIGMGSSYLFTEPYHGWKAAATGDARHVGLVVSRGW
jgi:membrane-associated phospholipid phosphatase